MYSQRYLNLFTEYQRGFSIGFACIVRKVFSQHIKIINGYYTWHA